VLFSVVICSYNRREHVVAAVDSVLAQTLSADEYEVVVVDNCSTDGTEEAIAALVDQHANLRYLYEGRLGLALARNTGWQAARAVSNSSGRTLVKFRPITTGFVRFT